jgi:hypothetical protein
MTASVSVKLWRCTFRGKLLAIVRNTESAGLGTHQPDVAAIMTALPHPYRRMPPVLWSTRADIGESVAASVNLVRADGRYSEHVVRCEAYLLDPSLAR